MEVAELTLEQATILEDECRNERHTLHRDLLEKKYESLITHNPKLTRTLVSFQANKNIPYYRWFKYKEGFSAQMVHYLLNTLAEKRGALLDPFSGTGAALFASQEFGWETTGIELLPVGCTITEARQAAEQVDTIQLKKEIEAISCIDFSTIKSDGPIQHIAITKGAFSRQTEDQLNGYLTYCENQIKDSHIKTLLRFAAFCILERISYTRKDGQYLRWDHRAGRTRVKSKFNKGKVYQFKEALQLQLNLMVEDLLHEDLDLFKKENLSKKEQRIRLIQGSCLEELCKFNAGSFNFILTSPPYCNRYDYTRTYALELVFLNKNEEEVKHLRQQMLSCTVENKEKVESLKTQYADLKREDFFQKAIFAFENHKALQEVLYWLNTYNGEGQLNNSNIPRMIANYFLEMALVIFEMSRVLKPGGKVAMVNDNVRYAGEEIPVDLILSDFAEAAGLSTRNIWVLGTGKGNSSQQMGKYGRAELRKCVYVWENN